MTSTTFFIVFIPILAILLLAINLLLAPHNPYQEKDSAFECGFKSFLGQNRTEFSVSFFLYALMFLLFDLEIVLAYPYSVSSYNNGIYGLVIMLVFFTLLTLGFVFELGKNALTIDSRQTLSYENQELSTPHAYLSTSNQIYLFDLTLIKDSLFFLIPAIMVFAMMIMSMIILYSRRPSTWNWKVLVPSEHVPDPIPPCQHPIILRYQLSGDNDYQIYKHVKCSNGNIVMPSLEQDRGTKCTVCHNNFCAHTNCSCRFPRNPVNLPRP